MEDWHQKLGHLLALERQRRSIEIDEIAAELKISADHLSSIEAGNPAALPSPLYFDLFAKSYAEYLGIDYTATVQAIKEQLEEIEQPSPEKKGGHRTEKGKRPHKPPKKSGRQTTEEPEEDSQDRSAAFRKLAWIIGGAIVLLLVFLVINALWLNPTDSEMRPANPPVERQAQGRNPIDETAAETAAIDWRRPPQGSPRPIVVRLQSRQRSWTEILTDGDTAWQGNLNAGSWVEETAQYRTEISVGVPSQVDVLINGQEVDLRNAKGRIYREDVNQLNLADVLAGERPFRTSNIEITTAEDLQTARQTSAPVAQQESAQQQTREEPEQTTATPGEEGGSPEDRQDEPEAVSNQPDPEEAATTTDKPDRPETSDTVGVEQSPPEDTAGQEED